MYAITNVSMEYISKIIKDIEKLPHKGYVRKKPTHEPTDSYFYLAQQLAKWMMISDDLNLHVDPVRMEITGAQHITISHVCGLDENNSKEMLADENLSQVCST